MRRLPSSTWLLLASLSLFSIFLALEPLLTFGGWGSDSGEYAFLTSSLLSKGRFLLAGYDGWGFGYPYFPGTFEVGAAVAAVTGVDPLASLEWTVPTLAALSVVPLFLLFRRLVPSDPTALLAAGLGSVAFPRVFVLSHAAPAALGDLLAVGALWLLLESRRDPRWLVPLGIASSGLVVTHHLSAYFFFISGLGMVVGLELYAPGRWSRRFPLRELLVLGGFVGGLTVYWTVYAPPFATIIVQGLLGAPAMLAPVLGLGGVALGGGLIHLRRRGLVLPHGPLWPLRWPPWTKVVRDAGILAVLLAGGLLYLVLLPLPGTADVVPPADLLWFLPFLLLVPGVAGGRRFATLAPLGQGALAWFGAITISAIFALSTSSGAVPPDRHAEYLALPLVLLASLTLGRAVAALTEGPRGTIDRRRQVLGLLAVGTLLVANAAVAYPPPALLEGFQEGFSPSDLAEASWAVVALPGRSTLASDHRLSDLYFGFSGRGATWSAAPCLFLGANLTCAREELANLAFPLGSDIARPIDAVAVDEVMLHQGTALDPNAPAFPVSPCALAFLQGPGFLEVYSQGGQIVWWVDAPSLPTPAPAGCPGPPGASALAAGPAGSALEAVEPV